MTVDLQRSIYQHLAIVEAEDKDLAVTSNSEAVSELNNKHRYGCCTCASTDSANMVTWQMIREASATDEELQLIKQYITKGCRI